MKTVVYFGSREIYRDFETAIKSLLDHTRVDKIIAIIEDDVFPFDLPVEVIKYEGRGGLNTQTRWGKFGLVRALLPLLLPDEDIIVSIDVDTIVEKDISPLFDLDMSEYYYAAVLEPYLSREKPYFNNGVCVMNLKLIRDSGKAEEMKNALESRRYQFVSQDCMNEILDRVLELPSDFNACYFTAQTNNIVVRHFANRQDWRDLPTVKRYRSL